jgi:putative NADH-flavin reductase
MKLAVLGATGQIGRAVVGEALWRGHDVTALSRNADAVPESGGRLTIGRVDASRPEDLERAISDHEAVVSAVGPRGEPPALILQVTRALAAAAMRALVRRVVVLGGAGTLAVRPGEELLATPDFPPELRPIALAHHEALAIWRRVKELDWTVITPPAELVPGKRSGKYRTGHDDLLSDAAGRSSISIADLAVAVLDAVEQGNHFRERITVASMDETLTR